MRRTMMKPQPGGALSGRFLGLFPADGVAGWSWFQAAGYNNWHCGIYEIQMFASSDASGPDLTTGKTAVASSEFSAAFSAGKAIDNTTATWWSTAQLHPDGTFWYVDLGVGNSSEVHSLTINPLFSAGAAIYLKRYKLRLSDDAVIWTTQTEFDTINTAGLKTFTNL